MTINTEIKINIDVNVNIILPGLILPALSCDWVGYPHPLLPPLLIFRQGYIYSLID